MDILSLKCWPRVFAPHRAYTSLDFARAGRIPTALSVSNCQEADGQQPCQEAQSSNAWTPYASSTITSEGISANDTLSGKGEEMLGYLSREYPDVEGNSEGQEGSKREAGRDRLCFALNAQFDL
jgi:hypothetical protein